MKDIGNKTKEMDLELKKMMVLFMKGNGEIIIIMDKENLYSQMEINILENLKITIIMEKEF